MEYDKNLGNLQKSIAQSNKKIEDLAGVINSLVLLSKEQGGIEAIEKAPINSKVFHEIKKEIDSVGVGINAIMSTLSVLDFKYKDFQTGLDKTSTSEEIISVEKNINELLNNANSIKEAVSLLPKVENTDEINQAVTKINTMLQDIVLLVSGSSKISGENKTALGEINEQISDLNYKNIEKFDEVSKQLQDIETEIELNAKIQNIEELKENLAYLLKKTAVFKEELQEELDIKLNTIHETVSDKKDFEDLKEASKATEAVLQNIKSKLSQLEKLNEIILKIDNLTYDDIIKEQLQKQTREIIEISKTQNAKNFDSIIFRMEEFYSKVAKINPSEEIETLTHKVGDVKNSLDLINTEITKIHKETKAETEHLFDDLYGNINTIMDKTDAISSSFNQVSKIEDLEALKDELANIKESIDNNVVNLDEKFSVISNLIEDKNLTPEINELKDELITNFTNLFRNIEENNINNEILHDFSNIKGKADLILQSVGAINVNKDLEELKTVLMELKTLITEKTSDGKATAQLELLNKIEDEIAEISLEKIEDQLTINNENIVKLEATVNSITFDNIENKLDSIEQKEVMLLEIIDDLATQETIEQNLNEQFSSLKDEFNSIVDKFSDICDKNDVENLNNQISSLQEILEKQEFEQNIVDNIENLKTQVQSVNELIMDYGNKVEAKDENQNTEELKSFVVAQLSESLNKINFVEESESIKNFIRENAMGVFYDLNILKDNLLGLKGELEKDNIPEFQKYTSEIQDSINSVNNSTYHIKDELSAVINERFNAVFENLSTFNAKTERIIEGNDNINQEIAFLNDKFEIISSESEANIEAVNLIASSIKEQFDRLSDNLEALSQTSPTDISEDLSIIDAKLDIITNNSEANAEAINLIASSFSRKIEELKNSAGNAIQINDENFDLDELLENTGKIDMGLDLANHRIEGISEKINQIDEKISNLPTASSSDSDNAFIKEDINNLFDNINIIHDRVSDINDKTSKILLNRENNVSTVNEGIDEIKIAAQEIKNYNLDNKFDIINNSLNQVSDKSSRSLNSAEDIKLAMIHMAQWFDGAGSLLNSYETSITELKFNLIEENNKLSNEISNVSGAISSFEEKINTIPAETLSKEDLINIVQEGISELKDNIGSEIYSINEKVQSLDAVMSRLEEKLEGITKPNNDSEIKPMIEFIASQASAANEMSRQNLKAFEKIERLEKQVAAFDENIKKIVKYID